MGINGRTRLYQQLGLLPSAVIGYSLGETVGYFATGVWPDRDDMLARLEASPLFRTDLAGPCRAAARAWELPPDQPVEWRAVLVNRPAQAVRSALAGIPAVRLLIVNTPEECVIGGHAPQVANVLRKMSCDAIDLDGTVAVHCDAVHPVADAYRDLHRFPTRPPEGVRYYSCAAGKAITLTRAAAAQSLLDQALKGFDFTRTIEQAYRDGVRLFLEMGPQASCTRMIKQILGDRPHLALSTSHRDDDDGFMVARAVAALAAEGVRFDLEPFFPPPTENQALRATSTAPVKRIVNGGQTIDPPLPPAPPQSDQADTSLPAASATSDLSPDPAATGPVHRAAPPVEARPAADERAPIMAQARKLMAQMNDQVAETARAHQRYLDISSQLTHEYAAAFDLRNRLLGGMTDISDQQTTASGETTPLPPVEDQRAPSPAFTRDMCMEFAVGSAARVLGPEFAALDTYPVRVRLPDEPLMLVDRIISIEGARGRLGPGRIVTEHDVLPEAWYLDADRAPVCISVEAGQADLFLCSYLRIDLEAQRRGEVLLVAEHHVDERCQLPIDLLGPRPTALTLPQGRAVVEIVGHHGAVLPGRLHRLEGDRRVGPERCDPSHDGCPVGRALQLRCPQPAARQAVIGQKGNIALHAGAGEDFGCRYQGGARWQPGTQRRQCWVIFCCQAQRHRRSGHRPLTLEHVVGFTAAERQVTVAPVVGQLAAQAGHGGRLFGGQPAQCLLWILWMPPQHHDGVLILLQCRLFNSDRVWFCAESVVSQGRCHVRTEAVAPAEQPDAAVIGQPPEYVVVGDIDGILMARLPGLGERPVGVLQRRRRRCG